MGDTSRRLHEYVSDVISALDLQDGVALAEQLCISRDGPAGRVAAAMENQKDVSRITARVNRYVPLGDMLAAYMACMQAYKQGRFVEACKNMDQAVKLFLEEFRNWETPWAMEALHTVIYEMRIVAERADKEMASQGKVPDKLKNAGSFLMKVFGALAGKGPKKQGALHVACQLFKIYFKLNTVHLCKSIIRSIDVMKFEDFPKRDRVTYKYYTGRLDVFNDNFVDADDKLTYALQRCESRHTGNVRKILKYLIPVKLSLGIVPSQRLLARHKLHEYVDIVRALRTGDLRLLHSAMEANEDSFLRTGVYMTLEKLELRVYQRLLKRIYLIQKQRAPATAHQLKMTRVQRALNWLGQSLDIEEVECIMSILIYKNCMKGYLSHKSKVVVLSKVDPFPPMKGLLSS